jgi:anaphase-promoting complex subunit 8
MDKNSLFSNSLIQDKEFLTDTNFNNRINNNSSTKSNLFNQNFDTKRTFKISNIQDNLPSTPLKKVNALSLKSHICNLKQEESTIKDVLAYASSLFDLKEYKKCSYVIKPYAKPKYQTCLFLYFFSEYFLIEQKKQEEVMDSAEIGSKSFNAQEYLKIQKQLESFYQKGELDSFNLYLYAVVLKELNLKDASKALLIKSLNQFPYNWSAWVELCLICKQSDMV